MLRKLFAVATLACALGACSLAADTAASEQAVDKFHRMLDAGQFDAIYDQSSKDMKKAVSREDLDKFLAAVHRKLGNVRSATRGSISTFASLQGTRITIGYRTIYDNGQADETFSFSLDGDKPILSGYHINSTALVVN